VSRESTKVAENLRLKAILKPKMIEKCVELKNFSHSNGNEILINRVAICL
jgi:hypothetical protein